MKQIVRITGKLPIVSGQGANGTWTKQEFIATYGDRYPKNFVFSLMNDKLEQYKNLLRIGDTVEVSFDIESREYNGRYYTNVVAWAIASLTAPKATTSAPTVQTYEDFADVPEVGESPNNEPDLPF